MQYFVIDIDRPGIPGVVHAKQGETIRAVRMALYSGGAAYTPPSGTTFTVFYTSAAGEGNYSEGLTLAENVLTVPLIEQMLDAPGGGAMCVIMFDAEGGQLGTWNLQLAVEAVPGLNSAGATQWFTALSEYVGQTLANAQEAKAQADRAQGYVNSIDVDTIATKAELASEINRAKAAEQANATAAANALSEAVSNTKALNGCWIEFADEDGNPTDEPYIHWLQEV